MRKQNIARTSSQSILWLNKFLAALKKSAIIPFLESIICLHRCANRCARVGAHCSSTCTRNKNFHFLGISFSGRRWLFCQERMVESAGASRGMKWSVNATISLQKITRRRKEEENQQMEMVSPRHPTDRCVLVVCLSNCLYADRWWFCYCIWCVCVCVCVQCERYFECIELGDRWCSCLHRSWNGRRSAVAVSLA